RAVGVHDALRRRAAQRRRVDLRVEDQRAFTRVVGGGGEAQHVVEHAGQLGRDVGPVEAQLAWRQHLELRIQRGSGPRGGGYRGDRQQRGRDQGREQRA